MLYIIKNSIEKGFNIVRNHFDTFIWLHLNKSFFIFLMTFFWQVYIWVDGSPAHNCINDDLFSIIQNYVNEYESRGNVYMTGGWNCRTETIMSSAIDQLFLDYYCPNESLNSVSIDIVCNNFGFKLLDFCKSNFFRIQVANGRLGNDYNKGCYTYACTNGTKVIDDLSLPEHNSSNIKSFSDESFNDWSDHAPISFNLLCNVVREDSHYQYTQTSIKWNNDLIYYLFVLNKVIKKVAEPLFYKQFVVKSDYSVKNLYDQKAKWFDKECLVA